MPLSLSDQQLEIVKAAAGLLPPAGRDSFLRSVAGRLADVCPPSDAAVHEACAFVLETRGVGGRGVVPVYSRRCGQGRRAAGEKGRTI